jgi:hypothetical protein
MQPTRKGGFNLSSSPLINPEDVPSDEEAFVDWLIHFLPKDKIWNLPEVYGYCIICCRPLVEHDIWFWKVVLEGDRDYEGYCVRCLFSMARVSL